MQNFTFRLCIRVLPASAWGTESLARVPGCCEDSGHFLGRVRSRWGRAWDGQLQAGQQGSSNEQEQRRVPPPWSTGLSPGRGAAG